MLGAIWVKDNVIWKIWECDKLSQGVEEGCLRNRNACAEEGASRIYIPRTGGHVHPIEAHLRLRIIGGALFRGF